MDAHTVFVYGTLKRGEPNHHYMSSASYVCNATSVEKLPLVIASAYNIPFVLDSPGIGHNVEGEIYTVDNDNLAKLDILENHPELYTREERNFAGPEGLVIKAWIYLFKKYRKELLQGPFYQSYESDGPHGLKYLPKYARSGPLDASTI